MGSENEDDMVEKLFFTWSASLNNLFNQLWNESQPRLHSSQINLSYFSHLFLYLGNLVFVHHLLPNTCLGCLFSFSPAHLCLTSASPSDSCDSNTTRRLKRKPRTEKDRKRQPRLSHCPTRRHERRRNFAQHLLAINTPQTLRRSASIPLLFSPTSASAAAEKDVFTPASRSQRVRGPGLLLGGRVSHRRVPAGSWLWINGRRLTRGRSRSSSLSGSGCGSQWWQSGPGHLSAMF